jgi:hypothetical protein
VPQEFVSIRVAGEDGLRTVARRLDEGPHILRRELEQHIRRTARPARDEVRRAILAEPMFAVRGWAPRSLRKPHLVSPGPLHRPVANAVQMTISTAGDPRVEIKMDDALIPFRRRFFARYVTGRSKRLRHPFMGHRSKWVAHPGVVDVWWPTLRPWLRRMAQARDEAVEQASQHLER